MGHARNPHPPWRAPSPRNTPELFTAVPQRALRERGRKEDINMIEIEIEIKKMQPLSMVIKLQMRREFIFRVFVITNIYR